MLQRLLMMSEWISLEKILRLFKECGEVIALSHFVVCATAIGVKALKSSIGFGRYQVE